MEWFLANRAEVFSLAGQHLVLAILPMVFGVLIAIPLAQLARQNRGLRSTVLTGSSLLYTIPSLALFIILPTILGTRILDPVNVVVALTIYAVALLVRAARRRLPRWQPARGPYARRRGRWGRRWR